MPSPKCARTAAHAVDAAEKRVIRGRRGSRRLDRPRRRRGADRRRQLGRHLPRNVVLNGQDIGRPSIVPVAPQRRVVAAVDQRRTDADPLTCRLHRAAHDHVGAELAADPFGVVDTAPIGERAAGGDHPSALDVAEFPRQRLGQTVGKITFVPAANRRERQHHHGVLRGATVGSGRRWIPAAQRLEQDRGNDDDGGGSDRADPRRAAAAHRGWRRGQDFDVGQCIADRVCQIRGRRITLIGALRQAAAGDSRDGGRHIGAHGTQVRRRIAQNRGGDFGPCRTLEGPMSREHFVQQHAERKLIGSMIDVTAFKLLWRHVRGRPDRRARFGQHRRRRRRRRHRLTQQSSPRRSRGL